MNKLIAAITLMLTISLQAGQADPSTLENAINEAKKYYVQDSLYIGLGYAEMEMDNEDTDELIETSSVSMSTGFKIKPYLGLEGRFSRSFDTTYKRGDTIAQDGEYSGTVWTWGVYLKPSYKYETIEPYILVGYGGTVLEDFVDADAHEYNFQWGLGLQVHVSDSTSLTIDYVDAYDDKGFDYRALQNDISVGVVSFNVIYKLTK